MKGKWRFAVEEPVPGMIFLNLPVAAGAKAHIEMLIRVPRDSSAGLGTITQRAASQSVHP